MFALAHGAAAGSLENREEQQAPWKNKERKCASWENRETGELLQIFCKSAGFEQYSKIMGALNKLLISNMYGPHMTQAEEV